MFLVPGLVVERAWRLQNLLVQVERQNVTHLRLPYPFSYIT